MAIPKYYEFYMPLLYTLKDGQTHLTKDVKQTVANLLHLTDSDLSEYLPSGDVTVFASRFGWATTYLKKAGLLEVPQKYHLRLTEEGQNVQKSSVSVTNDWLATHYSSFASFVHKKNAHSLVTTDSRVPTMQAEEPSETPQETLERVFQVINEQLAEDLLTEIMNQSPSFFERLVVELMKSMDYGDGFVTKQSGDDGIDGVIHEDKLGFNLIYIQAKRWRPSSVIGKPEIQKFAGAMMGPPKIEKGLFITTATF